MVSVVYMNVVMMYVVFCYVCKLFVRCVSFFVSDDRLLLFLIRLRTMKKASSTSLFALAF